MIETGFIVGVMTFIALIILVEKLPKNVRVFIIGHHLLSDIIATLFAMMVLPVNGVVSLLSAATVCLLFTLYLVYRRKNHPWKRLCLSKSGIKIETGNM